MTPSQIIETTNAVLSIRQHFANTPHCFNPDATVMECMEWLAGSGHSIDEVTYLLDTQLWEVIPTCDVEDAISEGWAVCVVWWSSDESVAIVQTC